MRKLSVVLLALGMLMLCAPPSQAGLLVGQCIEFAACWSGPGPTAWSDSLSLSDLMALGLGGDVPLVAAQTSQYVIRLGVTTITFDTSTGPVTEMLPEFSGGEHMDPCDFCEIDTVGMFSIPANATSAMISGTFGNSTVSTSAGVNVCLDSGVPCAPSSGVPEPGTFGILGAGFVGLWAMVRRKARL